MILVIMEKVSYVRAIHKAPFTWDGPHKWENRLYVRVALHIFDTSNTFSLWGGEKLSLYPLNQSSQYWPCVCIYIFT